MPLYACWTPTGLNGEYACIRAFTRNSGFPTIAASRQRESEWSAGQESGGCEARGPGGEDASPPTTPLAAPAPMEDQTLISSGL